MNNENKKTLGYGVFGIVKLYYSKKYKRNVVEKTVGPNFLRVRPENQLRLTNIINDYKDNVDMLKKESLFMSLMKIGKLDCCV